MLQNLFSIRQLRLTKCSFLVYSTTCYAPYIHPSHDSILELWQTFPNGPWWWWSCIQLGKSDVGLHGKDINKRWEWVWILENGGVKKLVDIFATPDLKLSQLILLSPLYTQSGISKHFYHKSHIRHLTALSHIAHGNMTGRGSGLGSGAYDWARSMLQR